MFKKSIASVRLVKYLNFTYSQKCRCRCTLYNLNVLCRPQNGPGSEILLRSKLHSSSPNRAIPPLLWAFIRPVLKLTAILFGRGVRKWWHRLPNNRKLLVVESLRRKKYTVLGSVGVLLSSGWIYYNLHLEENPITKRKRFNIFSDEQIMKLATHHSAKMTERFKDHILPPFHPNVWRAKNVVIRLLKGNKDLKQMRDIDWSLTVISSDMANAFVFPNGHIFVFSGMLRECRNDDQLGFILGHEMAHAILGHISEQLSNSQMAELLLLIPLVLIWTIFPDATAVIYQIISSAFITFFVELPFDRHIEREADIVALHLAAKSCFDVREAIIFWKNVAEADPLNEQSELWSNHPSHENRRKVLEQHIPSAIALRKYCKCPDLK